MIVMGLCPVFAAAAVVVVENREVKNPTRSLCPAVVGLNDALLKYNNLLVSLHILIVWQNISNLCSLCSYF